LHLLSLRDLAVAVVEQQHLQLEAVGMEVTGPTSDARVVAVVQLKEVAMEAMEAMEQVAL
jgi:hypothetical protein